ncbi:MAG: dTMP kinase [Firmicutes bacterium]|nr:dTMP kinase [Bacillota bacterium]
MRKGIFISVEGTDGSGKSTQINLIRDYLEEKGYNVIVTREPGGTEISEKIRSIILDPQNTGMGEITEMLLYASSRAQLVYEVIKPALKSGKIVICDRFIDSSFAYQGYGRGINLDYIAKVNNIALHGIMPDLTFFFDLSPEAALKRRFASSGPDRIEQENIGFHMKVYEGYKILAASYPERIKTINAERGKDEIFKDVKEWLDKLL